MIVPMCKGKRERTECKNYRGISLVSVVGKVYGGILADRVHKVTGDMFEDEQEGFRAWRGCVDQIFTLKEIGEKAREKKRGVYARFIYLEKAYDRVKIAICQVFRMYDVES